MTNGYVTFGLDFNSRYPDSLNLTKLLSAEKSYLADKHGFTMFAPMWTDSDASYGDVYYHVYDLMKPDLNSDDHARVKVCYVAKQLLLKYFNEMLSTSHYIYIIHFSMDFMRCDPFAFVIWNSASKNVVVGNGCFTHFIC